jgi:hypothetical protein
MSDITRNNVIIALLAFGTIILASLMLTIPLSAPAQASTVHHHKPWYCATRDDGNIRTQASGKSYICQPDGHGRDTWQIIRERVEN